MEGRKDGGKEGRKDGRKEKYCLVNLLAIIHKKLSPVALCHR